MVTDNLPLIGFIDKETLLTKYGEEAIFSLVFNFEPYEGQYCLSPFREDSSPRCYFQRSPKGCLRFVDWGNSSIIRGIRMDNMNCFDCVQIFFNLGNFYETLRFIQDNLYDYQIQKKETLPFIQKTPTLIDIKTRPIDGRDFLYWSKYHININDLKEDLVYPISSYILTNNKIGTKTFNIINTNIAYAYTEFENGKKKIYKPYESSSFISNCTQNNIGNMGKLPPGGRSLIITKSYKDCKVLQDVGKNVIWFQNEGMVPDESLLKEVCAPFDSIKVLFDNDLPGQKASEKIRAILASIFKKKRIQKVEVPKIPLVKDPADLCKISYKLFLDFIKREL